MKLTIIENTKLNTKEGQILLEKGDIITIESAQSCLTESPVAFDISTDDLPEIEEYPQQIATQNIPDTIASLMVGPQTIEPQSMLATPAVTAPTPVPATGPTPIESGAPGIDAPIPAPVATPAPVVNQAETLDRAIEALTAIAQGESGTMQLSGKEASEILAAIKK